jgi:hypothetical protein
MVPVRTSLSALLTGSAMIGTLAVAAARHSLLLDGPPVWSMDSGIAFGAKAGGLYLVMFTILHLVAQRMSLGLSTVYAGLAAAAFVATALVFASPEKLRTFIDQGLLFVSLGAFAAFGAIAGLMYHARAGYCAEGDNPHTLDGFLRSLNRTPDLDADDGMYSAASRGNPAVKGKISADHARIQTETAEYVDSPLQVRTSFGATAAKKN